MKKLVRFDGPLAGVCEGLGDYCEMDPLIFRILFLFLFFGVGSGVLLYLILWLCMPKATA